MKVTQLVGSPVLLGSGAAVFLVAAGTQLTPPRHLRGRWIAPGPLVPRKWGTCTELGLLGTSWLTLGCPAVPSLGSRSKTSQE